MFAGSRKKLKIKSFLRLFKIVRERKRAKRATVRSIVASCAKVSDALCECVRVCNEVFLPFLLSHCLLAQ